MPHVVQFLNLGLGFHPLLFPARRKSNDRDCFMNDRRAQQESPCQSADIVEAKYHGLLKSHPRGIAPTPDHGQAFQRSCLSEKMLLPRMC